MHWLSLIALTYCQFDLMITFLGGSHSFGWTPRWFSHNERSFPDLRTLCQSKLSCIFLFCFCFCFLVLSCDVSGDDGYDDDDDDNDDDNYFCTWWRKIVRLHLLMLCFLSESLAFRAHFAVRNRHLYIPLWMYFRNILIHPQPCFGGVTKTKT